MCSQRLRAVASLVRFIYLDPSMQECIEHCKEDGKRFAGTIHGYM